MKIFFHMVYFDLTITFNLLEFYKSFSNNLGSFENMFKDSIPLEVTLMPLSMVIIKKSTSVPNFFWRFICRLIRYFSFNFLVLLLYFSQCRLFLFWNTLRSGSQCRLSGFGVCWYYTGCCLGLLLDFLNALTHKTFFR